MVLPFNAWNNDAMNNSNYGTYSNCNGVYSSATNYGIYTTASGEEQITYLRRSFRWNKLCRLFQWSYLPYIRVILYELAPKHERRLNRSLLADRNRAAWHIYPASQQDMRFRTGSGNGGIVGTISDETPRGYLHWTTSNEIGLLNNSRGWQLRCFNGGTEIYNQTRSPIYYDSNDLSYYADPNGSSRFWGLGSFYLWNNYTVDINHPFGLYFGSDRSTAYAIYQGTRRMEPPLPGSTHCISHRNQTRRKCKLRRHPLLL